MPKEADRGLIAPVGELRLLEKRRQFQERGPDSPRQRNADDEPVNEKFEPVVSRLISLSHGKCSVLRGPTRSTQRPKIAAESPRKKNGETENPREPGLRPIIRRGLGNTNDFGERQFENAERVNLSNGKMDSEHCGRKKPAIIARICDGILSVKKAHSK